MLSLGIIVLFIGVIVVVVCALTPIPPPIGQLGWASLGVGVLLIVLAYVLPLIPAHTAAAFLA